MKKLLVLLLTTVLCVLSVQSVYAGYDYKNLLSTSDGIYYRICDDKYAVIESNFYSGTATIPAEIDGYKVTALARLSYSDYNDDDPDLTDRSEHNYIIPETVTSIGDKAFYSCRLKSVQIPGSVTSIGEKAFACNDELEEITIPGSVATISKQLFYRDKNLKKVTLGDGIKRICKEAFSGTAIEQLKLPASIEVIDKGAFYGCDSLKILDLSQVKMKNVGDTLEEYSIGYVKKGKKQKDLRVILPAPHYDKYTDLGKTYKYVNNNDLSFGFRPDDSKSYDVHIGSRFTIVDENNKNIKISLPKNNYVKLNSDGELITLKKGTVKAKTADGSEFEINVLDNPSLLSEVKSIYIKKGKTTSLKLTGKVDTIPNKYTSTKYAKITSKKNASTIKVKGVRKGTSTVKIRVNGVYTIKLKVRVV